jgi:hypothetical protein
MTLQFGSVLGSTVGLLVFLFICGTVGFLVYSLLAHPRFRRVEAREWARLHIVLRCSSVSAWGCRFFSGFTSRPSMASTGSK